MGATSITQPSTTCLLGETWREHMRLPCPTCGKGVRLTSHRCHHCKSANPTRRKLETAAFLVGLGVFAYFILNLAF